jgi:hypothetical protein
MWNRGLVLVFLVNFVMVCLANMELSAQQGSDEQGEVVTISLGANPIKNAKCETQSCNGSIATTGQGATLDYGCKYNAQTKTCSGTCYRCDGQNANSRSDICLNKNTKEECQPDSRTSTFQCTMSGNNTGANAHPCTKSGNSAETCCSDTPSTPAATGRSCSSTTCLKTVSP